MPPSVVSRSTPAVLRLGRLSQSLHSPRPTTPRPFVQPNPFMTAYDAMGIRYDNHNRYLHGSERSDPFEGLSLAVHVGRLVSMLLGLLTLLSVYAAAREVSPQRPIVALIATALVAFQPVFISLTSALTNDAAVICFASLSTWIALRIVRQGATPQLAGLRRLCRVTWPTQQDQ